MFSFFKREKSKKSNAFLALDIGTEVVKALVCGAEGSKARVLGVGRKSQKLGDMQNGVVLDIGSVIENCIEVIKMAEQESEIIPDQLIMGIAGELVKGTTMITTYTRKDPDIKIDLSELKNIIQKVQWKAFEQARNQISLETGIAEIDVKLVHAAIADTRIDGYRMNNPIGFQGKEVTVSIFNAFAPLTHYGALQTIAAELDMDLLAIAAEPFAVARALATENSNEYSGIFIDMGGGTTDIAVVRNGIIEGTKMFTLGGRTFTKRIAHTLNISIPEAEEIKIAYSNGKLEKHSEKVVREAMESDTEVWVAGVGLALSEFYNLDSLPSHIYLCGGGSMLPEIKQSLETDAWIKDLKFPKRPRVSFLMPKHITSIIDETKALHDTRDIPVMALANLAIDLAGEEKLLGKILKKAVRLMQI